MEVESELVASRVIVTRESSRDTRGGAVKQDLPPAEAEGEHGPTHPVADSWERPQIHVVVGHEPVVVRDELLGDLNKGLGAIADAELGKTLGWVVKSHQGRRVRCDPQQAREDLVGVCGPSPGEHQLSNENEPRIWRPRATAATSSQMSFATRPGDPGSHRGSGPVSTSARSEAPQAVEPTERLSQKDGNGVPDLPVSVARLPANRNPSGKV